MSEPTAAPRAVEAPLPDVTVRSMSWIIEERAWSDPAGAALRVAQRATAVLRALEEAAAERGWSTLRLETGTAQPDAIRFYQREGYREIPLYGVYVGSDLSICYERVLAAS